MIDKHDSWVRILENPSLMWRKNYGRIKYIGWMRRICAGKGHILESGLANDFYKYRTHHPKIILGWLDATAIRVGQKPGSPPRSKGRIITDAI